jgi:hypothetical protein
MVPQEIFSATASRKICVFAASNALVSGSSACTGSR